MTPKFPLLIVDDNLELAENLADILRFRGYEVDLASNGSTAISLLQQQTYSALVTDLRMPGLDGVQVLEQVKRHWPALPVVIMTAYAQDELLKGGSDLGYATGRSKALELDQLIATVDRLCGRDRRSVLIVENQATLRRGLREALLARQLRVVGCKTLKEGYTEVATGSFGVLVIDLRLPDGDGVDLASQLNVLLGPSAPKPAILYIAGRTPDYEQILRRMLQDQTVHLIEKPFNPARLIELVAQITLQDGAL